MFSARDNVTNQPVLGNALDQEYSGLPPVQLTRSQGRAAQNGALIDEGMPDESPDDSSEEESRPKVRVEAGIFFDGTGNNRNNTQTYQQQMDGCLTANAAGAISEDECSSELSQIMEGSYLNAETNVSKLENLYQRAGAQGENGEAIVRLSTYVPGVGTKFGEPDDGPSMGLGLGEQGLRAGGASLAGQGHRSFSGVVRHRCCGC
ncbi:hypothetical protein [Marinobacter sp. Arc7-DN-1]|uniref:hypothetical protein n=1 Tax=Marinobacter sp. Arc7-DN-1 TaxID=2304594 RepID=UPI0013C3285A|nr:hypothetical protein [Marinobacter sp. Arc7-DN-1]